MTQTQKRPVTTEALSAYLKSRHSTLSAAIHMLGLSQELLDNKDVDDDTLGRIARLYGTTLEQLAVACAAFEAPAPAAPKLAPAASEPVEFEAAEPVEP
jgi:hypothetical protein